MIRLVKVSREMKNLSCNLLFTFFITPGSDLNEVYQTIFIAFLLPLINNKYMKDL